MAFSFGFITNDATLMTCALSPYKEILTSEQGALYGWGMGYFQAGQPLLRKQPKAFHDPLDFTSMAHNLKANIILGQVKDTTVGGQRTENTPPFRYRNWIFCYSGTLNRFETIKEEMLLSVPDFIRRNIRGNTDSEHLFHLFLSFLNDTGRMDDPRIPPDIAARALAATLAYANRLITDRGGSPLTGCCLLSNGSIVLASRRTLDLKIIRNSSYSSAEKDGRPVSASHLKSVVILGGTVTSQMPGWEDVAENAIVTIDSQLNIKYSSPI